MKKHIDLFRSFIFLILVVFSPSAFSQGKLVIFGGVNYSVFHYTEGGHFWADIKSYLNADAGFSLKTSKWKYINPGTTINYRQKSFDITAEWGGLGGGNSLDMTSKLGYLNINLYPEIGFGSKARIYLQPGIYVGGLIRIKEHGTSSYWYTQSQPGMGSGTDDIDGDSGYMKGPDIGVRLNLGLEFFVQNNFRLAIESGISRGLNNTGDMSFGSYAGIFNSTNYSLTFGIVHFFSSNLFSPKKIESGKSKPFNTL